LSERWANVRLIKCRTIGFRPIYVTAWSVCSPTHNAQFQNGFLQLQNEISTVDNFNFVSTKARFSAPNAALTAKLSAEWKGKQVVQFYKFSQLLIPSSHLCSSNHGSPRFYRYFCRRKAAGCIIRTVAEGLRFVCGHIRFLCGLRGAYRVAQKSKPLSRIIIKSY